MWWPASNWRPLGGQNPIGYDMNTQKINDTPVLPPTYARFEIEVKIIIFDGSREVTNTSICIENDEFCQKTHLKEWPVKSFPQVRQRKATGMLVYAYW